MPRPPERILSLGARASRPHFHDKSEALQAMLNGGLFFANENALLHAHAPKCGRDARAPREIRGLA